MLSLWAHEAPADRLHRLEQETNYVKKTALAQYDLAEAAFLASDFERAAEVVERLLGVEDIPLDVYWLHGQLLWQAGDLNRAHLALGHYLSEGGKRPSARRIYAGILVAMNLLETAGVEYQKSGEHTGRPDDFLRAARLALKTKNPDLAVARLEKGLSQIGPAVSLREEMVRVRIARGERKIALQEIDALLKLAPSHQGWKDLRKEILELDSMDVY